MFPFYNPYYNPFLMAINPMFPVFNHQFMVAPPQIVPANQLVSNDSSSSLQVTKNIEKATEQPSKSVIQISSDSQQEIQQIEPEKIQFKKEPLTKKIKADRFLGFKEGIFQKENTSPNKSTRNLRKRAVLTRARLRKYKEKNEPEMLTQKKKYIQKQNVSRKLRESPRLSKNEENGKNKNLDKKPRNKQFGRLKKYLKCVAKTVDLPQMYTLKDSFLKIIEQKRQSLMLRKLDQWKF